MQQFFEQVQKQMVQNDYQVGYDLNSFNDILWGGYGVHEYQEPLHIVWIFAKESREYLGEEDVPRNEIIVNPVAVNHFTWLTSASYKNIDLFPYYKEFCEKYADGYSKKNVDTNWMNNSFKSEDKVKMELFRRFGYIAAAGDRHLAEFCPGDWYLASPERVKEMHFGLTTVKWRKEDLQKRLEKSKRLVSGEEEVEVKVTGEEGVNQICALLGLGDLITNVNMPNKGQISNLPLGAVVETNAAFRANSLQPVLAGEVPEEIYPLVSKICLEQEQVAEGIAERNVEKIFDAFAGDPLVRCDRTEARKMFDEMCENTKAYLGMYQFHNS